MSTVFLKLLNMSIAAGWLVLAAILFRCVFKKAPKKLRCLVWALAALRLVLPFTIESPIGLLPDAGSMCAKIMTVTAHDFEPADAEAYSEAEVMEAAEPIDSGGFAEDPAVFAPEEAAEGQTAAAVKKTDMLTVLSAVWLIGAGTMLIYSLASFLGLRRRISGAERTEGGVILCKNAPTPFIFGFIRPRIVLPTSVSEKDVPFAIAHERAHIERLDHLIKPLGFALLTVYWFNPLMWLAYILLCRDIELACDERVIAKCGEQIKKGYSEALVNCSITVRSIKACPVAFGEIGVKERVRCILDYKRSAAAVTAAALIACAAIGLFLLPTRSQGEQAEPEQSAELPSEENYDRIYLLGDECRENASMRIMFSSSQMRYIVVKDRGGSASISDSGRYRRLDYTHVTLISDEGMERVFRTVEDRLELETDNASDEDDAVFPLKNTWSFRWSFRLYKGVFNGSAYYYSEGSGYVWYPDSHILYLFGDKDRVFDELMKLDYFKNDRYAAANLKNALEHLQYPNCRLYVSEVNAYCTGRIKTNNSVHVFPLSYMIGRDGLGVSVFNISNPGASSSSSGITNKLTPGSLYTKGGYKNYQ